MTLAEEQTSPILNVVARLLEEYGYDGWQLRDVAERAHVSLSTIYKHFPARDELIIAALEVWMAENVYRPIDLEPSDDRSPFEIMRSVFRTMFEPWEEHPQILEVFVRALMTPGRKRLQAQGDANVRPLSEALRKLEPEFAQDVGMILTDMIEGILSRFVKGDIEVTDIVPAIERVLQRLEQAASVVAAEQRSVTVRQTRK